MGLWVPVELFADFLRKSLLRAKMTKNGQKCPPKWDFSNILKDFVTNFCLKL